MLCLKQKQIQTSKQKANKKCTGRMLKHYELYLETSPQVYALSLKRKTIHLF